jgi:hypothetical protein
MPEVPLGSLTPLAKLVLVLAASLIAAGFLWNGIAIDESRRFWRDLFDRPGGPMAFRFVLQPAMAALAALHDGIADARAGRSPYLWSLIREPGTRRARLNEGIVATARIVLLGIGMDAAYQVQVMGTFHPLEALLVAIALAFLPYLLMRGPIARLERVRLRRQLQRH